MKKQRNTNRRSIYFMTAVLILLMGIGFVQITSSYNKNKEKEAEIAFIQGQIDHENLRKIELNQTINDMYSRAFVEKTARNRFGLIYPNEILIDTTETQ